MVFKGSSITTAEAVVVWNLLMAHRNAGAIEKSDALRKRLERGKHVLPPN